LRRFKKLVLAETNVEAILGTMSSLGIRHHWWRGFSFNATQPYREQVDALKPRIERLVKLEERYGTKAMYHPGGGPYYDILEFLRNFDPRYVSVHYDTGHWLQVSQANMAAHLRLLPERDAREASLSGTSRSLSPLPRTTIMRASRREADSGSATSSETRKPVA
jgi:hypothetical protein